MAQINGPINSLWYRNCHDFPKHGFKSLPTYFVVIEAKKYKETLKSLVTQLSFD